ncbi:MAG: immunoglobulin domain-containing protein, partial [Candidatus Didemnitutus sp.]|nr:immunoglobulin domain-containing protein [Candidatus Didemnitutus sp.]
MAAGALSLVVAVGAWGFSLITDSGGYVVTWAPGPIPMQVKLATSPPLSDGMSQSASVVAAMNAWNAQLGVVQFSAQELGPGAYGVGNNVNEIVMDSTIEGSAFPSNTLAVTISYRSGNTRVESDIIFNTAWSWNSYRGNLQAPEDIRRVAIHELGHVLGLSHPDQNGQSVTAVMNSTVSNVDALQNDDITGGRTLYGAPGGVPANNNFANATTISLSSGSTQLTGTNVAATAEAGEPTHATEPARRSVWWKWTAPSSGSMTITTLGSNFDTLLAVYTGASVSSLTQVAANDDVQNGIIRTSTVTFNALSGTTYAIAVDGWDGYFGAITLNLSFTPAPVGTAPSITSHPSNQTINAGQSAQFSITASGTPTLSYQWQRLPAGSGTWSNLSNGGSYSGVTDATLTVSGPTVGMNGDQFRCVASNSDGSATSNAATLGVVPPNQAPSASFTLSAERAIGQAITINLTLGDIDGNFAYANLYVDSPGRGTLAIKADNTVVASSALSAAHAVASTTGNHTRVFTFTPADGVGSYTFRLVAVDAAGARFDTAGQNITVVAATNATYSLAMGQIDLAVPAGYNHLPLRVPVTREPGVPTSGFTASANAAWITPSFDAATSELVLTFSTAGLVVATNNATVSLMRGNEAVALTVRANVAQPNIISLLDDPARSRMYGLHQAGVGYGALVVFDPLANSVLGVLTLGQQPGAMAIRPDGSELAVLCAASKTIVTVDPAALRVTDTLSVASNYANTRVSMTTGRIRYGRGNIIYYVDGDWAPSMHVFDRSSRTVIQSLVLNGQAPQNTGNYGFGDFVVSPDGETIHAWGQYGWDAGLAGSQVGRLRVQSDGRLQSEQLGAQHSYTIFGRDPLDTPALMSGDGRRLFIKQNVFEPADVNILTQTFPAPVYAISPGGEVATTAGGIYSTATAAKLFDLGSGRNIQAVTSDYARLVYFDSSTRALRTVDLGQAVGVAAMGLGIAPAADSLVPPPTELRWLPQSGFDRYRVYLGTSQAAVGAATPTSPEFAGEVLGPRYGLGTNFTPGVTYYWRVDAVDGAQVVPGTVRKFTVSSLGVGQRVVSSATVRGHGRHRVSVQLGALAGGPLAWSASSPQPWISFVASSGSTPASLEVLFDASALTAGIHQGSVRLTTAEGVMTLPVELRVDPLAITRMAAAPDSTKVYALSEEGGPNPGGATRAYLVEIDALMQRIDRVLPVNSGVTDLAVHPADGRIYVTNWRAGKLLAVDRTTFALARTYDQPASSGYSRDFYRISAGRAGRLLVEPMDQWVKIYLLDTNTGGVVTDSFVREGGGAYDAAGRYYYHGENNTTGASLIKFDTNGDQMTQAATTPTKILSGYGSRNIVLSGQGNRVFWNGGVYAASDLSLEWSTLTEVLASSADGRYGLTGQVVYDVTNRQQVATLPATVVAAAFNAQVGRFVFQNGAGLGVLNLPGTDTPGASRTPADGSVVNPTDLLSWTPLPGATGYRVYLGSSAAEVAAATTASPLFLGEVTDPGIQLSAPLPVGGSYYWRVDILVGGEVAQGAVQTFTVSQLAPSRTRISGATVRGHGDFATYIELSAASPGTPWSVTTGTPGWVHFDQASGTTPTSLRVSLDARQLPVGPNQSSLTLTSGASVVTIPISLLVEPLAIVAIESDPTSTRAYALSEDSPGTSSRAYLLEIDCASERITRVVEAGSSATDLAWHVGDNRIYVTNWRAGNLLGFNPDSLIRERSFIFPPFLGTGSSSRDAYRVEAGAPGRVMVEAYDQWIYLTLFDTVAGQSVASYFAREGGGAYGASRRYYYHGENNSSGATLQKIDTAGDALSQVASVRVTSAGYYGSRAVAVSQNGSRVFWNGSVFDENLAELWSFGAEIFSTTADGRYAFGMTRVYDTVDRLTVYSMPVSTKVSAFNSTSGKLLVQNGGDLAFYPLAALPALGTPPSIVRQPQDFVPTGGVATFEVGTAGSAPFTFQWQRKLPASSIWSTLFANATYSGVQGAVLQVNTVTEAMNGDQFRCVVTNAHGNVTSAAATLWSVSAPAIIAQPVDRSIYAGIATTFSLTVSGAPAPSLQWQRRPAGSGAWNNIGNDGIYSGATSATLSIGATALAMNGDQFRCVASNSSGSVISSAATLTVIVANVSAISAGQGFSFFVRSDGTLWGMGFNAHGQLGDGNPQMMQVSPVQVASQVSKVSAGASNSHFVKSDGSMWSMGNNGDGQLGDGTTIDRTTPVQVAINVAGVSAGNRHSVQIRADGTLWLTGLFVSGTNYYSPALLSSGVSSAAARADYTLFIKNDGTLWAVGRSDFGALGDGTTAMAVSPKQTASGVVAVAAGATHSLFVKNDGTLWAAGSNSFGELGDGTTNQRLSPVQVASDVVQATAGNGFSLFIKTDGTLWGMGKNNLGQLGDGTASNRLSPVWIAGGVRTASAGFEHALFVKNDGSLWGMGGNHVGQLGVSPVGGTVNTPVVILSTASPPSIALQPGAATVALGGSASFVISAFGSPLPDLQWQRFPADGFAWANLSNGGVYSGVTSPTLTISGATLSMSGDQFRCVTSNSSGSLISSQASLTVFVPLPVITTHPASQTVVPGTAVNLSVAVTSPVAVTYQWRRGGVDIGGATSSTLSITSLQVGDEGSYTVVVTNSAGSVISSPAVLVVALPPVITTHPATQTVNAGSQVFFSVIATSNTTPSYVWRKNGAPIPGATSATHSIPSAQSSDEADYSVVVTNVAGSATSNAATLTVQLPPVITQHPASQSILIGATASFSVAASSTTTLSYQWQRLPSGSGTWANITGANYLGGMTTTLTAGTQALGNSGDQFRCVVTNAAGSVISQPASLSVASAGFAKFSAGRYHSLRLDVSSQLYATGLNADGQHGTGNTVNSTSAQLVTLAGQTVADIAAGAQHSLILTSAKEMWAAGFNGNGQLGDGTTVAKSTPFKLATNVVGMAAGIFHSAYLKADGTLWMVGGNDSGQLGNGTTIDSTTPLQIASGVVDVALGARQSFYLTPDGFLRGMGDMNGSGIPVTTPTHIATNVISVTAGAYHSLFLKTDGTLWSLGYNPYGQLGNGTTTDANTPVQIASGVRSVAAGYFHSAFIKSDNTLWTVGRNSAGQLGDGTTTSRS